MKGVIVVEGCDFTGKSTLIDQLAKSMKALVIKECDIPSNLDKVRQWTEEVNMLSAHRLIIVDRCPAISEYIYSGILRKEPSFFFHHSISSVKGIKRLIAIIHCDPGMEQVLLCNNEQMEGVKENLERLYVTYQDYMKGLRASLEKNTEERKVLTYNWTVETSFDSLLDWLNLYGMRPDEEMEYVKAFHDKFGVPCSWNGQEMKEFRLKFLREEIDELELALSNPDSPDTVNALDALLDLVYVAKGTALMLGISEQVWKASMLAVQHANMSKVRATDPSQSKRGTALDVIKPRGWQGPESQISRYILMGNYNGN